MQEWYARFGRHCEEDWSVMNERNVARTGRILHSRTAIAHLMQHHRGVKDVVAMRADQLLMVKEIPELNLVRVEAPLPALSFDHTLPNRKIPHHPPTPLNLC